LRSLHRGILGLLDAILKPEGCLPISCVPSFELISSLRQPLANLVHADHCSCVRARSQHPHLVINGRFCADKNPFGIVHVDDTCVHVCCLTWQGRTGGNQRRNEGTNKEGHREGRRINRGREGRKKGTTEDALGRTGWEEGPTGVAAVCLKSTCTPTESQSPAPRE
jgi:hypothetical protein